MMSQTQPMAVIPLAHREWADTLEKVQQGWSLEA